MSGGLYEGYEGYEGYEVMSYEGCEGFLWGFDRGCYGILTEFCGIFSMSLTFGILLAPEAQPSPPKAVALCPTATARRHGTWASGVLGREFSCSGA